MERRVVVGGFTCAMQDCNENSGSSRHLSFFRFPSHPERAQLWLQAYGIKKDIAPKKLYNNYRVCSKHFLSYMFLNDLKNRLQPHAVPCAIFNNDDTNKEDTTSTQNEINKTSTKHSTISNVEANVLSAVTMCSTTDMTDVNINFTDNETVSTNDPACTNEHKATQMELKLLNNTSRKQALKRKCDAAEKRAKRAKLKYKEKNKSIEDIQ
ncbi:uncharacterized protein LOC114939635 isoform X2 [Nylanderia fulva]|uniref:uncharacterized protein LOC114939635 isoform X2 n=1 Tax=Nylanderia fulva TaxID=613905 RepID=UPI0010FBA502|nr:uncharacterized protein LOC114939635 isoform X2 [Nylanderia fulva]